MHKHTHTHTHCFLRTHKLAFVSGTNRHWSNAHREQIELQEYGTTDTGNSAAHNICNPLYDTAEEITTSSDDRHTSEDKIQKRIGTIPQHILDYAYVDITQQQSKEVTSDQPSYDTTDEPDLVHTVKKLNLRQQLPRISSTNSTQGDDTTPEHEQLYI